MIQINLRLRNDSLSYVINENDYSGSPLLKQSELRLHKIFILNEPLITGGNTNVSENFMKSVFEEEIDFGVMPGLLRHLYISLIITSSCSRLNECS